MKYFQLEYFPIYSNHSQIPRPCLKAGWG